METNTDRIPAESAAERICLSLIRRELATTQRIPPETLAEAALAWRIENALKAVRS